MNSKINSSGNKFFFNWIIFTTIAFPVGMILSIIVAYTVNIIYPKETNLVLGLCTGAIVGYVQWFILRKKISVRSWWGLACALGVGIPFIMLEILDVTGFQFPDLPGGQIFGRLLIGFFAGILSGLFQVSVLKPHSPRAYFWIPASTVAWALCGLSSSIENPSFLGIILGGFVLAVISGFGLKWILNTPGKTKRIE
jgi:hypothetical protein